MVMSLIFEKEILSSNVRFVFQPDTNFKCKLIFEIKITDRIDTAMNML